MQKIESDFTYKGYRCLVVFRDTAFRCGYVALPSDSPMYRESMEYFQFAECHQGVSFVGKLDEDPSLWWIGFDCGHIGIDAYDFETFEKYFREEIDKSEMSEMQRLALDIKLRTDKDLSNSMGGTVKNQEYVEDNCRTLVDSIIECESRIK